jgi:pilus assembly protein Flp/PilA
MKPVVMSKSFGWELEMIESIRVLKSLAIDRKGVTAVEYALILGLIAAVIVGAVAGLGSTVTGIFSSAATSI